MRCKPTLKGDQKNVGKCYKELLKRKNTDKLEEMNYELRAEIQLEVMLVELDCKEDIKKGT